MPQPNRLARYVFRLGVAVCVLIVVATVVVVSFRWVHYFPVSGGWFVGFTFRSWPAIWKPWPGMTLLSLPTWMPLLAAMIPTYLAWRRLRRPLPGHCRKCGYDLTGNVTGVCSECGKDVEGKVPSE